VFSGLARLSISRGRIGGHFHSERNTGKILWKENPEKEITRKKNRMAIGGYRYGISVQVGDVLDSQIR
jgi:hypothetical protein